MSEDPILVEGETCWRLAAARRVARAIRGFRARLLAEHLGCESEAVERAVSSEESLIRAVETLRGGERSLESLEGEVPDWLDWLVPQAAVLDPEKPAPIRELAQDLDRDAVGQRREWLRVALGTGAVLGLAVLWTWTPLRDWTEPEQLQAILGLLRNSAWGPVLGVGVFAVASLAIVPVTALTVAAALVFGWRLGFVTALAGSALGACAGYLIGRVLWRDSVRHLAGSRLDRLNRALGRRGLLAAATVRLFPVAPFTVVNLVAGASRIGFRDFTLGTVLAMAPGTLLLTLAADRAVAAWREPEPVHIGLALLLAGLLVVAVVVLRRRLRA